MSKTGEIAAKLQLTLDDLLEIGKEYGGKIPEIPEGYEVVAYRVPKYEETVLADFDEPGEYDSCTMWNYNECNKFFVLKKKINQGHRDIYPGGYFVRVDGSDVYGFEKITIPNGYRFIGFRIPKGGEYYLSTTNYDKFHGGLPTLYCSKFVIGPRIIVERI